jgi:hypothetical protein
MRPSVPSIDQGLNNDIILEIKGLSHGKPRLGVKMLAMPAEI